MKLSILVPTLNLNGGLSNYRTDFLAHFLTFIEYFLLETFSEYVAAEFAVFHERFEIPRRFTVEER